MDLTNEIVEQHGFKRINNSMWRLGDIVLQNGYTHELDPMWKRILTRRKAFKVSYKGEYLKMITNTEQLNKVKQRCA